MTAPTDLTIAEALRRFLAAHLHAGASARFFFRISGFSQGAYAALLDRLAAAGWRLDEMPLEVRSIEDIPGHPDRVMEPARSATWYRNHVPTGHALVLIQNRLSTDAQSLKDLYPVTELSLSRDGLPQLIEACVTRYQLAAADRAALIAFVRRVAHVHHEPQLHDLVEFLTAVDAALHERPGTAISRAIVLALPYLGLFRCRELEQHIGAAPARGDRLLRRIKRAARIGSEVIDDRERGDYLRRLADAELDDDESLGGLSVEAKRSLLRRFIEGELRDDHQARLQVLQIDWREVQQVINPKTRVSRAERLNRVADQLDAALDHIAMSDAAADVLADLRGGREPADEAVEQLLPELGGRIGGALRSELRRLMKLRPRKHSDFLVGVTALAVELLSLHRSELQHGARLLVRPDLTAVSGKEHLPAALATFRALYGGCETAMPAVDWQLDTLWAQLAEQPEQPSDEEGDERERLARLELPFRVSVTGPGGADLVRGELIWQYRSDSPAAATALTLAAEYDELRRHDQRAPRLRVPLFNRCPHAEEVGDLDISRPIRSFGAWFEQAGDLRALLTSQMQGRVRAEAQTVLLTSLEHLEDAWGGFIAAAANGILAADSRALLVAYEQLLTHAAASLRTPAEAAAGFRALNQAWLIGPQSFERWALVPLLHPLKLLWWRERARYFNGVIVRLRDLGRATTIVDEPRYRRELAVTYGSSGFPPVLCLPAGDGRPVGRFTPVEEAEGYELFFREAEEGEPVGRDADALADDEAEVAAQRAVEGIAAVVQDYVETYPFVRDGLEIVLFECRNGALPGMLVDQLTRVGQRRGWRIRLSVIIHTSDRGAPLFRRVSEWVAAAQAMADQRDGDYFPPVSLKVLQGSLEALLAAREDGDIVILADVLAERGQRIIADLTGDVEPDAALDGYLPTTQARQEPFQRGDVYRRLLLTPPSQPAVARLFLLAQYAARERRAVNPRAAVHFYRELTLDEWELTLGRLHDHFNWVICYDPTIDRFLLQDAFPDKVQVIRYSLGLGAKRQHNLTVSSSHKAQAIVERRLAARLAQMLPQAAPAFLVQVARQLVAQAKQISGDIVLRAAGPGAFLNELIGLVAAKFETERRYRLLDPGALTTWILLDDFEHWFGSGKFPDLLFVAIGRGTGDELRLHLEVLEAKCVGQLSFAAESADAEEQVRRGVARLAPAFAVGGEHLDALYWYDQLYRAVAGNLTVELDQQELWELFRERLHAGAFQVALTGHAWTFCYDGQAGIASGPDEHEVEKLAQGLPGVPLRAHHYGRNELCQLLRELIEAGGERTPAEMWTPAAEPPPPPYTSGWRLEGGGSVEESPAAPPDVSPVPPEPPLTAVAEQAQAPEQRWLREKARDLDRALCQRGVQIVPIDPADADVGPSIVRFKLRLRPNESLRKIQGVADDLARDLALASTPIIDNVLRTNFVGVDIPRERGQMVELRSLLAGLGPPGPAELPVIIGVTPDGSLVIEDLSEFPHLLVAGATGSGKSVFLRSLLLSLMTQYPPDKLEVLIVDPKLTDFTFFNNTPYLRGGNVFSQPEQARNALLELVRVEMPRRQSLMASRNTTKIKLFNQRYPDEALPPIIALIDEYALLVSIMSKKEREAFEQDLMIFAAAARSAGIHLVLATQRPSADIVTSTLKANLPTRIAFRVASSTNSRVVLDTAGAENLLGRGDMLLHRQSGEIVRLQAPFMDEEEMQAYLAALARPR